MVGEVEGVRQLITILPAAEVSAWPGLQAIGAQNSSCYYKDQQALYDDELKPVAFSKIKESGSFACFQNHKGEWELFLDGQ